MLGLVILITSLASRERKPKEKPAKEKKVKEKKEKKATKTKIQKQKTSGWVYIIAGVIILLILAALGFWAYNTFVPGDDSEEVDLDATESDIDAVEDGSEEAAEPKLTEADVEESLITIDRSAIPGRGNILDIEEAEYFLPLSISNPTDRKARFEVSTNNDSWVLFGEYQILVEPESVKTVEMMILPDMDALKESNYMISINTRLEGTKIDYQEELSFVVREKKGLEASIWLYALAGLILLGLIILVAELVKRKKPAGAADKKKKKVSKKKEKDLSDINKELAALRKKTVLKLGKASY